MSGATPGRSNWFRYRCSLPGPISAPHLRCHSVNLAGSQVGPELNIPKNITEYFNDEELPGFIRNAAAYRAGTKMPLFQDVITADEARDIVHYLKQMKLEKTR